MIKAKQKEIICKPMGKAFGFVPEERCGKQMTEFEKRTYGMCNSCLWDFYHNDERGKILYQKLFIPKVALKTKSNEKAFKSDLRQKLKTLSEYEAEAKKSFQKWVRLRDSGLPCISCNNPNPADWCGSHYYAAGTYSGLMFDERNCNGACNTYCNKYLSGNLINYRIGLVKRYGNEFVVQLESEADSKRNYKYKKQELIDIKKKYDLKIKELTKN